MSNFFNTQRVTVGGDKGTIIALSPEYQEAWVQLDNSGKGPRTYEYSIIKEIPKLTWEIGKTYIFQEGAYSRRFRVDHIQSVKGLKDQAVGVSNPGDSNEYFDYEEWDSIDGWRKA